MGSSIGIDLLLEPAIRETAIFGIFMLNASFRTVGCSLWTRQPDMKCVERVDLLALIALRSLSNVSNYDVIMHSCTVDVGYGLCACNELSLRMSSFLQVPPTCCLVRRRTCSPWPKPGTSSSPFTPWVCARATAPSVAFTWVTWTQSSSQMSWMACWSCTSRARSNPALTPPTTLSRCVCWGVMTHYSVRYIKNRLNVCIYFTGCITPDSFHSMFFHRWCISCNSSSDSSAHFKTN